MKEKLEKLLKNIKNIPQIFWEETSGGKYRVIWLLDRQKPSVQQSWDFDEERIGITDDGRIIWGFDSGCSCPSPWSSTDFGDENYNIRTYKEFFISLPDFDIGWEDESSEKIDEILNNLKHE